MDYNTYLSDEEIDLENNENIELDQYGMPIEEVDEEEELEMRRIISNKLLSKNSLDEETFIGSGSTKSKSSKSNKSPKKKTMSLNDLNNLIDKKIEESKPKKFISKRSLDKKTSEPSLSTKIDKEENKRKFNPKLVPYLFSDEYKSRKFSDESKVISFDNLEFPSL
jgi:hypothetical protein